MEQQNEGEKITYFAETDARNKRVPFGIKAKDRSRHVYVIGKTGMGKSTMLENLAIQDIKDGNGMAFIDPHGKTAELLLDYVPKERIKDVLYFAPFDLDYPISFNVMEDVGPDKRYLVASGLMSAFKKIWVDTWSARMEYILSNVLLALLEFPGATLLSVNRMLTDKEYRKMVVDNISDVSVKSFWVDEFAKYTDRFAAEATPAIQNKVGQFVSNPLIRNIIGQPRSSFDIRKMMDEKKIIIINLSKGRVGEANANLLGSMLITKIYLSAMSRADVSESLMKTLPNFYLYVDEFQSFANESFADILSEARKYKLSLTVAHQYIEQMSEEVRNAVFGNVGTMVTFRVGAYDAEVLEKEFAPQFTAEDLVNLGAFQVYLKLMIDGIGSPPFSANTLPPIPLPEISYKDEIIAESRKSFASNRAEVEDIIRKWHEPVKKAVTESKYLGEKNDAGKYAQKPTYNNDRNFRNDRGPEGGNDHSFNRGFNANTNTNYSSRPPVKFEQPFKEAFTKSPVDSNEKNSVSQKVENEAIPVEVENKEKISLNTLNRSNFSANASYKKMPSQRNVSDLKSALDALIKKDVVKETAKEEKKVVEKTETIKKEPEDESKNPGEINAEELKKVLEI
ncbi:MAG: type IV secretion system DNA-binding domain-containing protein [Candidatus Paceibacterota bacterium]